MDTGGRQSGCGFYSGGGKTCAILAAALCLSLLAGMSAAAPTAPGFQLTVTIPPGSEAATARFEQFGQEVDRRVPAAFRESLAGTVTVSFELTAPLGEEEAAPPGGLPARLKRHTGRECRNFGQLHKNGRDILLNRAFAATVQAGPEARQPLNGFHGDWYRLAVGTVLHQLALAYDRQRPAGPLSATAAFHRLCGWQPGWLGGGAMRNTNTSRSPCPCELRNPAEFLAVNLEYYLMDPEYACRRPVEFAFLRQFFPDPFPDRPIRVNSKVFLAERYVPVDLDPESVRAVHYVLTTAGEELGSGFGHTLLRLVLQAPGAPPGSEPLPEMAEQVALGYQAFTLGDLTIDPIGGLLGKYHSLLFVYLFNTVQSRYGAGELRELRSCPLILSEEQRRLLVYRLLENYWQYQGAYKFITRNCATEIRDDIQASLPEGHPFQKDRAISPNGVARALLKNGLLDMTPFQDLDRARQDGYYFPDYDVVETCFAGLAAKCPDLKYRHRMNAFLERTTADYRRKVYEDLRRQEPDHGRALAADCYTLECRIRLLAYQQLIKTALRMIKKELSPSWLTFGKRSGTPAGASLLKTYQEAEALIAGMMPCRLLPENRGYGIPLASEWAALPSIAAMEAQRRRFYALREVFVEALRKEHGDLYERYAGAERNVGFFLRESAGLPTGAEPEK